MSLEAVRLVADWLADADTGVNAVLADVPRDVGDPAPAAVTVYDATRDGWVARRFVGAAPDHITFPCVAVTPFGARFPIGPHAASATADVQDGEQRVAVHYLARTEASADAERDGSYTLRAVRGSLTQFHKAPLAGRTRNGVQLVLPALTEVHQIVEQPQDVTAVGAVVVTYKTRETTP